MAVGRPTLYKPEYCDEIIKFFDIDHTIIKSKKVVSKSGEVNEIEFEEPNKLPTFERFAFQIGTHRATLINWCDEFPEFFDAYKKAKDLQKEMLIDLAIRGFYNPTFSIFTAKNITDMKDKVENENTNLNIDIELTPEQRKKRIEELKKKLNK